MYVCKEMVLQINLSKIKSDLDVGVSVGTDVSLQQDDNLAVHGSANSATDPDTSKMLTLRNAMGL